MSAGTDRPRARKARGLVSRRVGFRVAAVILAVSIAVGAAEFALRVAAPQVTRFTGAGIYVPHPELGHVLRPNMAAGDNPARIATNSLGFRDREYPPTPPAGGLRILGIGDSFTFGAGPVEDNFLDILESSLDADGSRTVEVINLGVPAYNTRQEALHLREFGLPLSPDLVILAFFVGNDIEENESDTIFTVIDGELADQRRRPGPVARWLWRSHLYRKLRPLLLGTVHAAAGNGGLEDFLEIERRRLKICRVPLADRFETGYRRSESRILSLQDELAELAIDLLVLLIPDEFQVSSTLLETIAAEYDLDLARFDIQQPQRRIGRFLSEHSIAFIDLLEPLRRSATGGDVYLPRNTHLNRRGNVVAADALAEHIRRRYLDSD